MIRPEEFTTIYDTENDKGNSYVDKDMLPSSSDEDEYESGDEGKIDQDDENNNKTSEFQQKNPNFK